MPSAAFPDNDNIQPLQQVQRRLYQRSHDSSPEPKAPTLSLRTQHCCFDAAAHAAHMSHHLWQAVATACVLSALMLNLNCISLTNEQLVQQQARCQKCGICIESRNRFQLCGLFLLVNRTAKNFKIRVFILNYYL